MRFRADQKLSVSALKGSKGFRELEFDLTRIGTRQQLPGTVGFGLVKLIGCWVKGRMGLDGQVKGFE